MLYSRILVPVDGSAPSECGLREAIRRRLTPELGPLPSCAPSRRTIDLTSIKCRPAAMRSVGWPRPSLLVPEMELAGPARLPREDAFAEGRPCSDRLLGQEGRAGRRRRNVDTASRRAAQAPPFSRDG